MIVAQIGSSLGAIGDQVFAIVIFMSVATTLLAPPLLRVAFRDSPRPPSRGIAVTP